MNSVGHNIVTPGGDDWLSHGIAGAANGAINGGLTNVGYGMVSGENMSLDNTWNQFGEGTGPGAIAGFCKGVYKHQTKFSKVDSGPGGAAPAKGVKLQDVIDNEGDITQISTTVAAVEGANNLWFPVGQQGIQAWIQEGSLFSSVCNLVPGLNAVAGLHDWFSLNQGWNGPIGTFVPGLAVAAGVTYGALSMLGRY